MKKFLLLLFFGLTPLIAHAGVTESIEVQNTLTVKDISTIFHREQRSFHCYRYKELSGYFKHISQGELEEQIKLEIHALKLLGKKSLTWREKVLLKRNITVLEKLLKYRNIREGLHNLQEKTCKLSEKAYKGTTRAIAWGSNAIVSTMVFPIRAASGFGVGFVSGKYEQGEEITYDIIGPNLYGTAASNMYLNTSITSYVATNPWALPFIIAPAVDNEVLDMCRNKNSLRHDEVDFCNRYTNFKTNFLAGADYFEELGAKLSQKIWKDKNDKEKEDTVTTEELLDDLIELNEDNFCEEMVKIGAKFNASKDEIQKNANIEMWKIGANPGRYGTPEVVSFLTPDDKMLSNPEQKIYRNVVISLGPASWQTEELDTGSTLKSYEKTYKRFKKLAKKGRKIFQNSKNIKDCERLKRKHKFSYEEMTEIIEDMENNKIGKALFENDKIKTAFKYEATFFNLFDISNLHWEFVESGDIESIANILQSEDVANIILVIHGTEKGKIIDSNFNELPKEFFKNISPSIMSLNFFSCYSQQIDSFYKISYGIGKSQSYHKLRHLSFVELDETYKYKSGQVPIQSFASYFSDIDDFLDKSTRGNMLNSSLIKDHDTYSSNVCKFYVRDLDATKTTYSLALNNNYIGVVSPKSGVSAHEFDCSIISKEKNTFRLLDINVENNEDINLDHTSFSVLHPELGFQVLFDFKDIRSRKDNTLKGVISNFSF